MNFNAGDETQSDFQIAPLIDIVFLLLVFFIVSYSMAQIEYEMGIELPKAKAGEPQSTRLNELVVNIGPDGDIVVNRQSMTRAGLLARLRRLQEFRSLPNVIIRADEQTMHKYVVGVMDICAQAGVESIRFHTRGEEKTNATP